jgi:AcrR family transcriptional regulator
LNRVQEPGYTLRVPSHARNRLGVDERRDQLLRIGVETFSVRPYDGISIDEIAALAGVSKGLLYHYFPSKRDFYVAVVRASADEMRKRTEPDPALPPLEGLRAGLDAYLDYVEHHAQGYLTVHRGGIGADEEVRAIVTESRTVIADRILAGLGAEPAPPALRTAVWGWIGFVEAAAIDWLERRELPRDTLRELMVLALVSALDAVRRVDPGLELDLSPLGRAA